jgi:hypothetical protein
VCTPIRIPQTQKISGCLKRVAGGDHGFLKNNPKQSSRAYPILSDASVFPGSKIGDDSTAASAIADVNIGGIPPFSDLSERGF